MSKHPARERHARSAPHVSLLVRPGVDRAAVTNELAQARLAELVCGPFVHELHSGQDHRVVEQTSEAVLLGEVALDLVA